MIARNIVIFAIGALGLSFSLTIFMMSCARHYIACNWYAPEDARNKAEAALGWSSFLKNYWDLEERYSSHEQSTSVDMCELRGVALVILIIYSLLSLPIAVLLLVGIQTRKSGLIRAWLIATIVQFVIEIGVIIAFLSFGESE